MAPIGWIPGPGDGVKKSLRLVNKDPQRFAPVLFDRLRFVLDKCGIETSPEELLDQIFDASRLKAEIADIQPSGSVTNANHFYIELSPTPLTAPLTPQQSSPRSNKGGGKQKSKTNSGSKTKVPKDTKSAHSAQAGGPLVQMSEQWIEKNLKQAVGKAQAKEIITIGYSRQLFYSPKYHPCAATHIKARLSSAPDSAHANHDAFHYKDSEVIAAVNKRKKSLRKKYGNLPNLKDDK